MPIAIETAAANEQHYELPPEFFVASLGPNLKYPQSTALTQRPLTSLRRYSGCLFTKEELAAPLEGDMGPVLQVQPKKNLCRPSSGAAHHPAHPPRFLRPPKSACYPCISIALRSPLAPASASSTSAAGGAPSLFTPHRGCRTVPSS